MSGGGLSCIACHCNHILHIPPSLPARRVSLRLQLRTTTPSCATVSNSMLYVCSWTCVEGYFVLAVQYPWPVVRHMCRGPSRVLHLKLAPPPATLARNPCRAVCIRSRRHTPAPFHPQSCRLQTQPTLLPTERRARACRRGSWWTPQSCWSAAGCVPVQYRRLATFLRPTYGAALDRSFSWWAGALQEHKRCRC